MERVRATIDVANGTDKSMASGSTLATARSIEIRAVVAAGAVMLGLQEDLVEFLGLKVTRRVVVSYA